MDRSYLQDLADTWGRIWWAKIVAVFPELGTHTRPPIKLNNRLKTTAGRAFFEENYIDLSTELFWEHTENFTQDTIPHELAHIAAYKVFGDEGHGMGWKMTLQRVGIKTTRLHHMVNSQHAARKAKV